MTERQHTWTVTAAGALAGAVVSYLFFTERGRTLRAQVMPALDELESEVGRLRGTVERTLHAASESWQIFNEVRGRRTTHADTTPANLIPF